MHPTILRAGVAQLVEHHLAKVNVESSNLSTRSARLAQLVEHYLDTVGVTGSSPVLRTIFRTKGV